jgi:hypothetical protein
MLIQQYVYRIPPPFFVVSYTIFTEGYSYFWSNTPKHIGGMWYIYIYIYCYIDMFVHVVDIFEEVSARMHGQENLQKKKFKMWIRFSQIFQKSRSQLQILSARNMT